MSVYFINNIIKNLIDFRFTRNLGYLKNCDCHSFILRKKMKKVLCFITIVGLTGCSTILNGTNQKISVTSTNHDSENIKVTSSNIEYIETLPATLHAHPGDRKAPITISTIGNCINHSQIILRTKLADSYWLNAFNGIGFFIDYATGSMWQYPETAQIEVRRKDYCQDSPQT
jgi:hypothetical protein